MRILLLAIAGLVVAGCSVPFVGGPNGPTKAECDQIAAQAIQTKSARDAKRLAAQAAECYARVQQD